MRPGDGNGLFGTGVGLLKRLLVESCGWRSKQAFMEAIEFSVPGGKGQVKKDSKRDVVIFEEEVVERMLKDEGVSNGQSRLKQDDRCQAAIPPSIEKDSE